MSLLPLVFSSHDPDAAQTVCEIVTNGFVLSSHFLIVFVYREAFVWDVSQTLPFCPVSVPLRDPVWYRLISSPERGSAHACVQGSEQWFIRTGREVKTQSCPKKILDLQSTFIRLPDFYPKVKLSVHSKCTFYQRVFWNRTRDLDIADVMRIRWVRFRNKIAFFEKWIALPTPF